MSNNGKALDGTEEDSVVYRDGYNWAKTDKIMPNPWNPNVMDHNTLQMLKVNLQEGSYDPLVVSPARVFFGNMEQEASDYIVVDGEQRLVGAKELGIQWLKVEVKHLTDAKAREECYSRGKVRGQLDPLKEGHFFELELEALGSEAAVAEKYKVSRSYVAGRRSLLRAPSVILDLFKTPEKTYKKVVTKEHRAEVKKAKEHVKEVQKEKDVEPWQIQQARNSIPDPLDEDDVVPRGTLTVSHVEALTALPEKEAIILATRVMERDLTVRDTEQQAKNRRETLEKEERFRKALEKAKSPTCPECGSAPRNFGSTEDDFRCDEDPYSHNYWDYMKTPEEHQRKKERLEVEKKKERSADLSETRQNPPYIRRAEELKTLLDSMKPWVLHQVLSFTKISKVSISGIRKDGKFVSLVFPSTYGRGLSVTIADPENDDDIFGANRKSFSLSMEKKDYKKLPFKTKVDLAYGSASPENRALVHYFFDTVVLGHGDPILPEDPDELKKILLKYGELEEEVERPECFGRWLTDDAEKVKGEVKCHECPDEEDCKVENEKYCSTCGLLKEKCEGHEFAIEGLVVDAEEE